MKKALGMTIGVILGFILVALVLIAVVFLTGIFSAIIAGAVYMVFMIICSLFGLTMLPFWYFWVAIFIVMIVEMIFSDKRSD